MVYGVIERRKVKVMEKKEQKHLYADTVEQNKRANHFLAIGYIVFYLCVLCVVGIACLRGIRTVGYTVMIAVLIILATAGTLVLYQRRKDDPKISTLSLHDAFRSKMIRRSAILRRSGCLSLRL